MPDALLLLGTTDRAPEIRHEVAAAAPDPIIWLEREGRATVWASSLDLEPLRSGRVVDDIRDSDELGYEELRRDNGYEHVFAEMARRALAAEQIVRVAVPWELPLGVGDHLRAGGIEVVASPEVFAARRRAKRAWELDGMRAAGAAAQAALLEAARLLRELPDGLTCERVREHMTSALLAHGAESEEILIHSGTGIVGGHEFGIRPDRPRRARSDRLLPAPPRLGPVHRHGAHLGAGHAERRGAALPRRHPRRARRRLRGGPARGRGPLRPRRATCCTIAAIRPATPRPAASARRGPSRASCSRSGTASASRSTRRRASACAPTRCAAGDTIAIEPHLAYEGVGEIMVEDTVRVGEGGAEHLFEPLPSGLDVPGA